MLSIAALILPLLAKLPGQIGDYFKGEQEIKKLEQDARKELQLANIKMSGELAKAELERQKAALKATGKNFKYFTFVMWFGPYVLQLIYPPLGKQIFDNMLGMPEWYAQSCVAIMFTIWGISVSAPVISNIFNGIGAFFQHRREYKLHKTELEQQLTDKQFFDRLRDIQGYVTQEQVNKYNEAKKDDK